MSVKVMAAVWELDLPQAEKMTLLVFADHADHDGRNAFPSLELVAWKCGCSKRTVQRHVRSLEDKGVMVLDAPGGGRGNTHCYRVLPTAGDKLSPFRETVTSETERVTPVTRKGDTAMSPEPSVTTREPPYLRLELQEDDASDPPPASESDFSEVWDLARRGSRKKAWAEYRKAVPELVSHDVLFEQRRRHVEAAREDQFVAHLFRWIRDRRWEENLPDAEPEEDAATYNPFDQTEAHLAAVAAEEGRDD